jgi:hypothetical protein
MSKKKNSVQKLIGFERFTKYGVRTDKAEFAFFAVEPTNISVMSSASIDTKVHHLMMLLSMVPDLELIALDSCECFDSNKEYVRRRLQEEKNESVRNRKGNNMLTEIAELFRLTADSRHPINFIGRIRRTRGKIYVFLITRNTTTHGSRRVSPLTHGNQFSFYQINSTD